MEFSVFGLLVGVDNLAVIAGLGLTALSRELKLWLLGTFAVFEGLAPALGYWIGASVPVVGASGDWLGTAALALCAALVVHAVLRGRELSGLMTSRTSIVVFAALLSLDNLLAGFGFAVEGVSGAVSLSVLGGVSVAMCVIGLLSGEALRRLLRGWAPPVAAAYLATLAAFHGLLGLA